MRGRTGCEMVEILSRLDGGHRGFCCLLCIMFAIMNLPIRKAAGWNEIGVTVQMHEGSETLHCVESCWTWIWTSRQLTFGACHMFGDYYRVWNIRSIGRLPRSITDLCSDHAPPDWIVGANSFYLQIHISWFNWSEMMDPYFQVWCVLFLQQESPSGTRLFLLCMQTIGLGNKQFVNMIHQFHSDLKPCLPLLFESWSEVCEFGLWSQQWSKHELADDYWIAGLWGICNPLQGTFVISEFLRIK